MPKPIYFNRKPITDIHTHNHNLRLRPHHRPPCLYNNEPHTKVFGNNHIMRFTDLNSFLSCSLYLANVRELVYSTCILFQKQQVAAYPCEQLFCTVDEFVVFRPLSFLNHAFRTVHGTRKMPFHFVRMVNTNHRDKNDGMRLENWELLTCL